MAELMTMEEMQRLKYNSDKASIDENRKEFPYLDDTFLWLDEDEVVFGGLNTKEQTGHLEIYLYAIDQFPPVSVLHARAVDPEIVAQIEAMEEGQVFKILKSSSIEQLYIEIKEIELDDTMPQYKIIMPEKPAKTPEEEMANIFYPNNP